ncbi:MAG: CoA transferase, partial [Clostridiales Family XIII bacterium]|nr:CoA transferase [Clostridiales Family XIII bacterium]
LHKQRTGKGVRIDVAMLDCAFYMCEAPVLEHSVTGEFKKRTGNHDPSFAPCGEFAARDGNAVIAVTKEEEWSALCGALGLSALAGDPLFCDNESRLKNRESLTAEIERATASMGRYEIEKRLRESGVPAAAVQTVAEFINDPKARALDVIAKVNQPGVGAYMALNTPIRFSKTPVVPTAEAPSFPGAHTTEILSDLGYGREKIDGLIESGAVGQSA